jgi:beta-galactosidase
MKFNTTTIMQSAILVGATLLTACGGSVSVSDKNAPLPSQTAPVITVQPVVQYVKPGNAATFTVVATGAPPLHYQWKRNGATVGGDAASYTTPVTARENNGE